MMMAQVNYEQFKQLAASSASAFRVFWTTDQGPFQCIGSPMNGEDVAFMVTMALEEMPESFETDFPNAIRGEFIAVG